MSPFFIFLFFVTIASGAFSLEDDSIINSPLIRQSQKLTCGRYGYLDGCASACEPRCSTYENKDILCIEMCVTDCKCNPGFVIDDDSGLCVATKYCKKPKSNKKTGQKGTKGKPKEAPITHEA